MDLPFLFQQDSHSVGSRERIQVRQVVALEWQGHDIDQALVLGNTAVGGGEDSIVKISAHA